jgi:hypothetical protein
MVKLGKLSSPEDLGKARDMSKKIPGTAMAWRQL